MLTIVQVSTILQRNFRSSAGRSPSKTADLQFVCGIPEIHSPFVFWASYSCSPSNFSSGGGHFIPPTPTVTVPSARWIRRFIDTAPSTKWSDATVLLGGGGARGLAHLGAIKAIGQSGVGIGRMVGVSMGALMASLCAVHRDVAQAEIAALEFLESETCASLQQQVLGAAKAPRDSNSRADPTSQSWRQRLHKFVWIQRFLTRAAGKPSLLPATVLTTIVDALLPDIAIEELSTPLHIIVVDLRSGKRVTLSTGSLREAVVSSMSIPGVFPSVRRDNQLLADVGVYDSTPCDLVREMMKNEQSQEELIVVDVGKTTFSDSEYETALQSVLRFQDLAEQQIRQFQLAQADIVVRPQFGTIPWFDFSESASIIDAGYQAAQSALSRSNASFV